MDSSVCVILYPPNDNPITYDKRFNVHAVSCTPHGVAFTCTVNGVRCRCNSTLPYLVSEEFHE